MTWKLLIHHLFPFAENLKACFEDEGARGTPNEALAKWGCWLRRNSALIPRSLLRGASSFTRLQMPSASADGGQVIRKSRGFTLIEMIIVMSIIVTLLGFITINLVRSQQTVSITSTAEILAANLKQQQLKSMIGDTEGRASSDSYGIHFDQTAYTMFHGSYVAGEPTNSLVNLPQNLQFKSPGTYISFKTISGEISPGSISSVVLQDVTNGNKKTIEINSYGVIIEVN